MKDKKFKITKLPNAEKALLGKETPKNTYYNRNNVGKFAENTVKEAGYNVDSVGTVDLPDLGVEMKSRDRQSKAPHTVGSMKVKDIINTPYDVSPIKEKFLQQLRIKHDQTYQVVTETKVYDFSFDRIQKLIEEAYEHGRAVMTTMSTNNDDIPTYIPPLGNIGYFEKTSIKKNSFSFRLRDSGMKDLELMALSGKTFQKFFQPR